MRCLAAIVVGIVGMALPGLAGADDFPSVECTLSADAAKVLVIASNPGSTSYSCVASCKANVTGQRPLQPIECTFSLRKNAAEKAVCTEKGKGARYFSAISPTRFTCQPK
jgi:hypothetical protein